MADVQPLRALHYALEKTGGLQPVVAPPYDVIDAEQRARALRRSRRTTSSRSICRWQPTAAILRARRRRCWRTGAREGVVVPGRRARDLAAGAGLRRPRRPRAHAARFPRARAGRGVRPRPDPAARAHPPRTEGGSPAADARDAGEPLADLRAVLRPRERGLERARAGDRGRPRGRRRPTPTGPSTASGASPTRRRSRRSAGARRAPSC